VLNEFGDIKIRGIDGSFNIKNLNGNIDLQINKISTSNCCEVLAENGNIHAQISPEVINFLFFIIIFSFVL
jgi:DUF4097 and DUF4098 domain-containing protein YvlB